MKAILLGLSIVAVGGISAQNQGEIVYTTKINLHAELPDNENSEMLKSMIPEFETVQNVLLYTSDESLYKPMSRNELEEEGEIEEEEREIKIKIEMDSPETSIYTNIREGISVEQRDLMGKMFLITDTLKQSDWKITGEEKTLAGFVCQKAQLITDKDTIIVWFTPQVAISTGPNGLGGLPGLIINVSMNHGNYTIHASSIIKREIGKKEIKAPKKGKKITNDEFIKLQELKMKQIKEQFDGGGNGNVFMIND